MDGRELPRVVYVGGVGRSGSTLVERLLAELPGVCPLGEMVHMWQRSVIDAELCGCGEPFPRCSFWREVGSAAFGGWDRAAAEQLTRLHDAVDRTRYIPLLAAPVLRPARQGALARYVRPFLQVYRAAAQVSGTNVVVDSSKHASLAYCLRRTQDLDLRVVHLVRDSRAVAHSWATKVHRPDSAAETYMTTYAPATAAAVWNSQNTALQLLARSGTPVLRVRYEDLVAAPGETLLLIANFAGIRVTDDRLRFLSSADGETWANLGPAHTASGNPMRFAVGRIAIQADERWRTAMTSRHRRTVTALTLPLLALYGYTGVKP